MTPHVFEGGEERIVTQNEFPIQTTLTAVRMDLKPGPLREMHWHPHADEWQFYVQGPVASDHLWVARASEDRRVRPR